MTKKEFLNSKICKNPDDVKLSRWLAYWRFKTEKIVFVFGDFDILNYGSISMLVEGAEYGSVLIVGLTNDENKFYIHSSTERAFNLAAQHYVDYVVIVDKQQLDDLIKKIKPNIILQSNQQQISDEIRKFAEDNDILIKTFNCPSGFSNVEFKEKLQQFLKK